MRKEQRWGLLELDIRQSSATVPRNLYITCIPDGCAGDREDVEKVVLHEHLHLLPLLGPLPLLVGHLVPPEPVLVVAGKAVYN